MATRPNTEVDEELRALIEDIRWGYGDAGPAGRPTPPKNPPKPLDKKGRAA